MPGDGAQEAPADEDTMRRRFEAAERIRVHETPLARPALRPGPGELRAHFASEAGRAVRELMNPHVEPRVTEAERASAVPASVLLAFLLRPTGPTVIVTRRPPAGISFPGHWVFPGGRADEGDADPVDTALREAEEEIGLPRERVEVIGRLGDYVSHSGFRIAPIAALVEPPVSLVPHPAEVDTIAEIELARLLDPRSYFLYRFENRADRAHFGLETEPEGPMLTGVTVSIAIGLYDALLESLSP